MLSRLGAEKGRVNKNNQKYDGNGLIDKGIFKL